MDRIVRAYMHGRKCVHDIVSHDAKGQTMTEYALILAAIAIAAYLTYQVMGQDIQLDGQRYRYRTDYSVIERWHQRTNQRLVASD
jgi:hypothetical protein